MTVAGLTISGAQAGDYTLTQPTTTANITPAGLTVSGITAANMAYDASTAATLNTAGATLAGVFSGDTVNLGTILATGTFASKNVGTGITVTVAGLTISGAQAGDYTLTQPTTTANITPAGLTVSGITAANKVYNANTTATLNTSGATLVGVFSGDTVTLNTGGATGTFASKNVGTAITVTVAGLTISGAQAGDYTLTQPTTTANITPAGLTVSGITAANKVYNANTTATLNTSGATLVGVFSGDTVTLNTGGATGNFASKNVGTAITVTVAGLTISGAQAGDYTLTQPTTTANITPAGLTVSGITAANKVYNANTTATLNTSGATLVGVFSGDTVTLNTGGATGNFGSKNVGTAITVTVAGLTISGAQAGDYTLTQPTTTANITPAGLTVSGITAANKVYNANTTATLNTSGATLVGVFSGDTVTLNTGGATGNFASKNVGTAITVTVAGLTISGAQAGDYTLTQPTTTANITPAGLTVSGITAANKVYNANTTATLNTSGATLVGVFSGDTVTLNTGGATGTFASKDVGTAITVTVAGLTISGAQAGDYTLTQPATTANITPAGLTVSGITAANKVYNANTTATLNTSGATLVGVFSGDTVTLNTGGATGTFDSKNVGTAITVTVAGLTISGAQAGDYTLTQPVTTANITQAVLTITAVTNTKVYDGTTSAAAVPTVSGLQGSDTVTNLSETYDTPAVGTGKTLSVATYTVNDGNGGANYTVSTVTNMTGVITAAVIDTIFGNMTPTNTTTSDGNAVELGVKFESSEAGYITGVRFYKGAGNTGTHVGHLWTSTGSLLATATFTGETASGWQQVNFATPVAITAGTIYVASYFAPVGHYADDYNYFASSGVTNGPLTALANSTPGGDGVYKYGASGGFPNTTYKASNYWVDVMFSPPASTATQLVVHTQPSSAATAGVAFGTQPVIYEEDQFGNLETGDNTTVVTVALNGGAGPLQGTLTATVSGGVATFTNLADNTAETLSLKFTSPGLTNATSNNIVVSPAAATQLVMKTQPSATATAGMAFATQPVIDEEDQFGNLETSDSTHTVTAARGSMGTASLQGTSLTVTLAGGVATFGGLFYDKAETMNMAFSTNAGGVSSATSSNVVVSPAAASQLVITQQPSATATAGVAFATQPVVKEEDAFNNVITGDNSTVVTAALSSGTGPLQGTLTATVSGGVATFTNLADNTAETLSLKFTSPGLTNATSNNIVVSPAAATQLVMKTQPSATATAGMAFATQPVIDEEDQFGNLETSDSTHTVTAARGSMGTASLQGTNLTVTLAGGVATFGGLFYDKAETMNMAFSTNASGVSSATSSNVVVSPAAASQLVITQQPSATATAGVAFATQPVVKEEDAFNNVITGDNSTVVTAALSSGTGPLQGTLTATVSGGVATFTNLADNTAETLSLKFTSPGLTNATSNNIVVSPAAATQLVMKTQPSATATAGMAFATQPVIDEEDQFGNLETSDSTHTVTAARGSMGTASLQGTSLTVTLAGGVATFGGLFYDKAETMNMAFSTNASGVSSATSSNVVVSPAAASQLVITQQPSATATAGVAFATQPVVKEEDAFNNVITGDNSAVVTAALSSGTGPLQGTLTATVSGGVATFTNLADSIAETITLKFTGAGLTSAPSNSIVVIPATTSYTIFGNMTPTTTTTSDANAVELGVKFESSEPGYITGVRFYKGAGNTGTHVGHLWTSTGSLLATATFTGETASGWQQVNFATPVAITAGTIYVASYFAPVGHYADDYNYFASSGVTNGPLTALANSTPGGDGVYKYGASGGFPNTTYKASNYWVDVIFSTSVQPMIVSGTSAARGGLVSGDGNAAALGTTNDGSSTAALDAVLAEWTSSDSSTSRAAQIMSSVAAGAVEAFISNAITQDTNADTLSDGSNPLRHSKWSSH